MIFTEIREVREKDLVNIVNFDFLVLLWDNKNFEDFVYYANMYEVFKEKYVLGGV